MRIHRIYGIVYRYIVQLRRSYYRLVDIVYWPILDMVLWGVTSIFIRTVATEIPTIVLMLLSGVIFWLIVFKGQNDLSVSVLDDLWNKNLVNIFVSPIRYSEWLVALLINSTIRVLLAAVFSAGTALLLYQFNVFTYGFKLIPIVVLLLLCGWWVGFLVNALILRYGSKVGFLAWSAVMIISPFSAIYYPVSVLPQWAQYVAMALPTSYMFEAAREVLNTGNLDMQKVVISAVLNGVFLVISALIMWRSFYRLLDKGLTKVY